MFGLFHKKKPRSAMDEFIELVYGPNPPSKSAVVRRAIALVETELLGGKVELGEIEKIARELNAGPLPYSTHDLAVAVAQRFYMEASPFEIMRQPAEQAREKVFEWSRNGLVVPLLAKTFIEKASEYIDRVGGMPGPDLPMPQSLALTSSDFNDAQLQEFIIEKVKHSPDFDLVRSWLSGNLDKNAEAIANICIKRIRAASDAQGLFEQLGIVTDTWTNHLEPHLNSSSELPPPKVLDACVQIVSQILIFTAVIVDLYGDSDVRKYLV